jgi:hypothetical protein
MQCGDYIYAIIKHWYAQPFGTRIKCPEWSAEKWYLVGGGGAAKEGP